MSSRHGVAGFALVALVVVATCPRVLAAQDRVVRGVAVDSAGKPIPNAAVSLNDGRTMVFTDAQGRFLLPLTLPSDCAIQVRRSRYHIKFLNLPSCADTTVRLVLARSPDDSPGTPRCGTRSTALCEAPDDVKFEVISAGQAHTCGITADRIAWCWGDGRKGALGADTTVQRWPVRVATNLRFTDIVAGGNFTCGVASDGVVYCWGTSEVVPGWPKRIRDAVAIGHFGTAARLTAGRRHACALDEQNRASCWGWNVDGETGNGSSGITSSLVQSPTPVAGDHRFISLSAGMGFTCGVTTEGRLLCWGSNVDRVLGNESPHRCGDVDPVPCSSDPVVVSTAEPVRQVAAGTTHACVLSTTGNISCWGTNGHGQVGDVRANVTTPQPVTLPAREKFAQVASGGIETCAVTTNGNLYCWGLDPRRSHTNDRTAEEVRPRLIARDIRQVSMGQTHSCAVTRGGRVVCWGDTVLGAFGPR